MDNVKGFFNGYAPSFTFATSEDNRMISFNYYLDPVAVVDAVTILKI